MMTQREVFEKVKAHLLTQNAKALSDDYLDVPEEDRATDAVCAYRNREGFKCAIGCLISDETYDEFIETAALGKNNHSDRQDRLLEILDLNGVPVGDDDIEFLEDLQTLHDMCEPSEWPSALKAMENDLTREGV